MRQGIAKVPPPPAVVEQHLARGHGITVCYCGRIAHFGQCDVCGYASPERRAARARLAAIEREADAQFARELQRDLDRPPRHVQRRRRWERRRARRA